MKTTKMKKNKWILSTNELPNFGMGVLVKMKDGRIFYAVYCACNEFDVHMVHELKGYRKFWFKHSMTSVWKWKYFNQIKH